VGSICAKARARGAGRLALGFVYSIFTPSHRGGSGSPLVCLHGFTDTWRTWELVLPELERHHDVLAPTLLGHAGGPPLEGEVSDARIADAVEAAMDDAGLETVHFAGNSLGGYVALLLAARGRAKSVVALAPAGGWAEGDPSREEVLRSFVAVLEQLRATAPHTDALIASVEGRRLATRAFVTNFEHIPVELLAHLVSGAANCGGVLPMVDYALDGGGYGGIEPERITCPVRIVWGTADELLPWPSAAERYRNDWLPQADWIELEGIGHCPQLDVPLETAQLIVGFTGEGPGSARSRKFDAKLDAKRPEELSLSSSRAT